MNLLDLLNQLILWERSLEELDLITLCVQCVPSSLVDVLEEKNLDILSCEWLEVLRLDGGGASVVRTGWRVECGGRGGRETESVAQSTGEVAGDIFWSGHFVVSVQILMGFVEGSKGIELKRWLLLGGSCKSVGEGVRAVGVLFNSDWG